MTTNKIRRNDLKKGDIVVMKDTGWKAEIMDNKKGNIRTAKVHGPFTDIDSVYTYDIDHVIQFQGKPGKWIIEYTPAEQKQVDRIKGFMAAF